MAKSLNSSLVIVLSFLNSHLSILDFGLPVSFNHLFLENKHETTKHLLITTTTKNIHLWNCQIAKKSKKFETSICKKTSIQSSSSIIVVIIINEVITVFIITIINIIVIIIISSLINIWTILADPDPGLSLRVGGRGFFPPTKNVAPDYFQRKSVEENRTKRNP